MFPHTGMGHGYFWIIQTECVIRFSPTIYFTIKLIFTTVLYAHQINLFVYIFGDDIFSFILTVKHLTKNLKGCVSLRETLCDEEGEIRRFFVKV